MIISRTSEHPLHYPTLLHISCMVRQTLKNANIPIQTVLGVEMRLRMARHCLRWTASGIYGASLVTNVDVFSLANIWAGNQTYFCKVGKLRNYYP